MGMAKTADNRKAARMRKELTHISHRRLNSVKRFHVVYKIVVGDGRKKGSIMWPYVRILQIVRRTPKEAIAKKR
jgi:hypothetical protein